MRRGIDRTRNEAGFTLVELMVAAFVLVIGMLGILGMLQTGYKKTALNNQRVAATNFIREVTETARQVAYIQLTPSNAAAAIQNADAEMGSGTPWKVVRRGTTFTVQPTVCTFDDPGDGIATVAPANRCPDNPTVGATNRSDQNGDDFRRITLSLSWRDGSRPMTFTQATLIANPSGGLGPRITSFTGPSTIVTSGNVAHFDLTTTFADTVHWNADDGTSTGDAVMVSGNTAWSIDWQLLPVGATGSVADGTYSLTAQAYDDRNIAGDAKSAQVTINRTAPLAPTGFRGGQNARQAPNSWVEFEWNLNRARDIVGYRVFWAGPDKVPSTTDDQRVCPAAGSPSTLETNDTTACIVTNAPTLNDTDYFLVAYDYPTPNTGVPRAGTVTEIEIKTAGNQPAPPGNPSKTGIDHPTLRWTLPASGPTPTFYRIYRGGTGVVNRIGRSTGLEFIDTSVSDLSHQYWVTAVDDRYNESPLVAFQ